MLQARHAPELIPSLPCRHSIFYYYEGLEFKGFRYCLAKREVITNSPEKTRVGELGDLTLGLNKTD